MAKKLKEMEVQWRKEKEEANETFQQERKVIYWHVNTNSINILYSAVTYYLVNNCLWTWQKYEEQIDTLQRKVMEQSMTMSMYSSITPDEFHGGADEDVFGEYIYIVLQY